MMNWNLAFVEQVLNEDEVFGLFVAVAAVVVVVVVVVFVAGRLIQRRARNLMVRMRKYRQVEVFERRFEKLVQRTFVW